MHLLSAAKKCTTENLVSGDISFMRLFTGVLCVCLSVCHLSCGRDSQSIFMKLCTIVRNPKSNIEFVTGQNPTIPSPTPHPNFHPLRCNAFLMARSERHSNAKSKQVRK